VILIITALPVIAFYDLTIISRRANLDHRIMNDPTGILCLKLPFMQTIHPSYNPAYSRAANKESLVTRFFTWCEGQEQYRFGWLAAIITIHGCVLTPLTVLTLVSTGNNITFWGIAIGAMAMALITNLAAMPTKVTIPVFLLSVLIDIAVIVSCIVIAFTNV